jgi:hypothetical protein
MNKETFLKRALSDQYFDLDLMNRPETIEYLIKKFKSGDKLNYILNLMLFSDFTKWNRANITAFLDVMKDLLSYKLNIENKIITLAHNPI